MARGGDDFVTVEELPGLLRSYGLISTEPPAQQVVVSEGQARSLLSAFDRGAGPSVDKHGKLHSAEDGQFVSKGGAAAGLVKKFGKLVGSPRDVGKYGVQAHDSGTVVLTNGGDGDKRTVAAHVTADDAFDLADSIENAKADGKGNVSFSLPGKGRATMPKAAADDLASALRHMGEAADVARGRKEDNDAHSKVKRKKSWRDLFDLGKPV